MATCPFCNISADRVMEETKHAIAIPDAYPITAGHALVLPRQHVVSIFDLTLEELSDVWSLVSRIRTHLSEHLNPDGFTIGINDGAAAGQTVPHAHVHVIPRYAGDDSDPRGGIRKVIPARARYWEKRDGPADS